ncbi:MAG: response regulator [Saprospiraceae bacterium]|nr:response regulator [Saprospiraceae bacterium]
MEYTCIIVDDEAHSRETTKLMLQSLGLNVNVLGMAKNALEGSDMIHQLNPDFVILDIQMPGKTGIEMLDMIPDYKGEIIFVTAYDQYAIEAFKKGAIHYMLKPLDPEELEEAIGRVRAALVKTNPIGKYLSLSTSDGWVVIRIDDIQHCVSFKNYTTIHLKDEKYTISKTLKEVEERLPSDRFYRVHNSHLINIDHIQKVLKSDGGNVLLANNSLVPISKGKKKDFFDWFQMKISGI